MVPFSVPASYSPRDIGPAGLAVAALLHELLDDDPLPAPASTAMLLLVLLRAPLAAFADFFVVFVDAFCSASPRLSFAF